MILDIYNNSNNSLNTGSENNNPNDDLNIKRRNNDITKAVFSDTRDIEPASIDRGVYIGKETKFDEPNYGWDYVNSNPEHLRAINQSLLNKMKNSSINFLATTTTSFLDGVFGDIVGLGQGLYQGISDSVTGEGDFISGFANGFINNVFSTGMNDIKNYFQENYVNYNDNENQAKINDNNPFNDLTTYKFWGDDLFVNTGFTVGIGLSMFVNQGSLLKLNRLNKSFSKSLDVVSKASEDLYKSMKGTMNAFESVADANRYIRRGGVAFKQNVDLAGDIVESANRINSAQKRINAFNLLRSASTEGRIEAISIGEELQRETEEFLNSERGQQMLLTEAYNRMSKKAGTGARANEDAILFREQLDSLSEEEKAKLKEELQVVTDEFNEHSRGEILKAQAANFVTNLPILMASNAVMYGKNMTKAVTRVTPNEFLRNIGKRASEKATFANMVTKGKDGLLKASWRNNKLNQYWLRGFGKMASEAGEEMFQQYSTDVSRMVFESRMNNFTLDLTGYKYNREVQMLGANYMSQFLNASAKSFSETFSKADTWTQGMVGAITGLIPMANAGRVVSKIAGDSSREKSTGGWFAGGILEVMEEGQAKREATQRAIEKVNPILKKINDSDFVNYIGTHLAIDMEKNSIDDINSTAYKDAVAKQIINDYHMMNEVGLGQDYLYDLEVATSYLGTLLKDQLTPEESSAKQKFIETYKLSNPSASNKTDNDIILSQIDIIERELETISNYNESYEAIEKLVGNDKNEDLVKELAYKHYKVKNYEDIQSNIIDDLVEREGLYQFVNVLKSIELKSNIEYNKRNSESIGAEKKAENLYDLIIENGIFLDNIDTGENSDDRDKNTVGKILDFLITGNLDMLQNESNYDSLLDIQKAFKETYESEDNKDFIEKLDKITGTKSKDSLFILGEIIGRLNKSYNTNNRLLANGLLNYLDATIFKSNFLMQLSNNQLTDRRTLDFLRTSTQSIFEATEVAQNYMAMNASIDKGELPEDVNINLKEKIAELVDSINLNTLSIEDVDNIINQINEHYNNLIRVHTAIITDLQDLKTQQSELLKKKQTENVKKELKEVSHFIKNREETLLKIKEDFINTKSFLEYSSLITRGFLTLKNDKDLPSSIVKSIRNEIETKPQLKTILFKNLVITIDDSEITAENDVEYRKLLLQDIFNHKYLSKEELEYLDEQFNTSSEFAKNYKREKESIDFSSKPSNNNTNKNNNSNSNNKKGNNNNNNNKEEEEQKPKEPISTEENKEIETNSKLPFFKIANTKGNYRLDSSSNINSILSVISNNTSSQTVEVELDFHNPYNNELRKVRLPFSIRREQIEESRFNFSIVYKGQDFLLSSGLKFKEEDYKTLEKIAYIYDTLNVDITSENIEGIITIAKTKSREEIDKIISDSRKEKEEEVSEEIKQKIASVTNTIKKLQERSKTEVSLSEDSSHYTYKKMKLERQSNFVSRVIDGVEESKDYSDDSKKSFSVGNLVDIIARDVFAGKEIDASNYTEYLDEANNKNKENGYSLSSTSEESVIKIVENIKSVYNQLKEEGYTFFPEDLFFYIEYNEKEKAKSGYDGMGGVIDLLAMDKEGNLYIIDFKNKKWTKDNEKYTESNLFGNNKYAYVPKWTKQQSAYATLAELEGLLIAGTGILPLSVKYDSLESAPSNIIITDSRLTSQLVPKANRDKHFNRFGNHIITLPFNETVKASILQRRKEVELPTNEGQVNKTSSKPSTGNNNTISKIKKKKNPVKIRARYPKDLSKSKYADGIIAYGVSSTGKYAEDFGGTREDFKEGEVIMISVNGKGRPNQAENVEKTKKAIIKAINKGVTAFVADVKKTAFSSHNYVGEGAISKFLEELGLEYYEIEKNVGVYITSDISREKAKALINESNSTSESDENDFYEVNEQGELSKNNYDIINKESNPVSITAETSGEKEESGMLNFKPRNLSPIDIVFTKMNNVLMRNNISSLFKQGFFKNNDVDIYIGFDRELSMLSTPDNKGSQYHRLTVFIKKGDSYIPLSIFNQNTLASIYPQMHEEIANIINNREDINRFVIPTPIGKVSGIRSNKYTYEDSPIYKLLPLEEGSIEDNVTLNYNFEDSIIIIAGKDSKTFIVKDKDKIVESDKTEELDNPESFNNLTPGNAYVFSKNPVNGKYKKISLSPQSIDSLDELSKDKIKELIKKRLLSPITEKIKGKEFTRIINGEKVTSIGVRTGGVDLSIFLRFLFLDFYQKGVRYNSFNYKDTDKSKRGVTPKYSARVEYLNKTPKRYNKEVEINYNFEYCSDTDLNEESLLERLDNPNNKANFLVVNIGTTNDDGTISHTYYVLNEWDSNNKFEDVDTTIDLNSQDLGEQDDEIISLNNTKSVEEIDIENALNAIANIFTENISDIRFNFEKLKGGQEEENNEDNKKRVSLRRLDIDDNEVLEDLKTILQVGGYKSGLRDFATENNVPVITIDNNKEITINQKHITNEDSTNQNSELSTIEVTEREIDTEFNNINESDNIKTEGKAVDIKTISTKKSSVENSNIINSEIQEDSLPLEKNIKAEIFKDIEENPRIIVRLKENGYATKQQRVKFINSLLTSNNINASSKKEQIINVIENYLECN